MKALAGERIGFAVDAAKNPENTVLLKIGLETDSDYSENDMPYEHIWFKLIKFEDDRSFTAELTQEPYYVKGIHTGDTGKYALEDITDWIIYTPERAVTPDDAYLLKR